MERCPTQPAPSHGRYRKFDPCMAHSPNQPLLFQGTYETPAMGSFLLPERRDLHTSGPSFKQGNVYGFLVHSLS